MNPNKNNGMIDIELEAAQVALKLKPEGNQARTFFRYVSRLTFEAASLREIEGQEARNRQIDIGKELSRYHFPNATTDSEQHIAQWAAFWQISASHGGKYYPEWMRKRDEDLRLKHLSKQIEQEFILHSLDLTPMSGNQSNTAH